MYKHSVGVYMSFVDQVCFVHNLLVTSMLCTDLKQEITVPKTIMERAVCVCAYKQQASHHPFPSPDCSLMGHQ